MNKKIIYLTIAVCTLLAILCSCTTSSGDSLLEVVAGVKGESSEISSVASISSDISSQVSSEAPSSEAESDDENESEDETLDIVYPETNYSTEREGYVKTQTDPLTLRSNPSLYNYTTILMIPKGATFTVKGATGNFLFVEYKGKLGYVNGDYVGFEDSSSSSTATTSVDEQ